MLYWRKIKRDANRELETRLDTLQKSYHDAMTDLTNRERVRLVQYGQQILSPVFSQLGVLRDRYQTQRDTLQHKAEESRALRQELDQIEVTTEA